MLRGNTSYPSVTLQRLPSGADFTLSQWRQEALCISYLGCWVTSLPVFTFYSEESMLSIKSLHDVVRLDKAEQG